jgi:hypothetical protein
LVAAVYEFDHWLDDMRERDAFGVGDTRNTVSPFAKVQSFRPFISHSSAN